MKKQVFLKSMWDLGINSHSHLSLRNITGTSLVVQWLKLQTPNVGHPDLIPGQGTRSHMPQLRPAQTNKQLNLLNKEMLVHHCLILVKNTLVPWFHQLCHCIVEGILANLWNYRNEFSLSGFENCFSSLPVPLSLKQKRSPRC